MKRQIILITPPINYYHHSLPVDGHLVAVNGDDVLPLQVVLGGVTLHIATTVKNTTVNAHP